MARPAIDGPPPGPIETPIFEQLPKDKMLEIAGGVPMGRLGQPGEIDLADGFDIFFNNR